MIAGLTGCIGSGKSVVSRLFEMMGCAVFNSDLAAKEIYFEPAVRVKVIDLLGPQAYISKTRIDKSYISKEIFSNTHMLHQLNSIIHPAVKLRFQQFAHEHTGRIIIKESALLFEAKLETQVEKIILVAAAKELRIKRVMQRDGLEKGDVLKKIASQLPQEEKIRRSNFVINNNERDLLIPQVLEVFGKLK